MSAQFRVLVTDRAWPDCRLEQDILQDVGAEIVEPDASGLEPLLQRADEFDAIATCWADVSSETVRRAHRCRVISRFGIGLDNIAVATATERNIPVTNVPDYCVHEVSDHALALLLAMARQLTMFDRVLRSGKYETAGALSLRRLQGQTLGLLGLGRIARCLVPKARAVGLEVIACNTSGDAYGTGCAMVGLDELLARSDYLSLHVPVTEKTQRMIGRAEFQQMKPGASLINTSRGGLVDHDALAHSLESGHLRGAGLDVFDPEPPNLSHPIFQHPRVIATPHVAFQSAEALHELRTRTARQIRDVLAGVRPECVVNPEVYGAGCSDGGIHNG